MPSRNNSLIQQLCAGLHLGWSVVVGKIDLGPEDSHMLAGRQVSLLGQMDRRPSRRMISSGKISDSEV